MKYEVNYDGVPRMAVDAPTLTAAKAAATRYCRYALATIRVFLEGEIIAVRRTRMGKWQKVPPRKPNALRFSQEGDVWVLHGADANVAARVLKMPLGAMHGVAYLAVPNHITAAIAQDLRPHEYEAEFI
jgi:hypothetical protein